MFDYINVNKGYKILDNITGNKIDVVNFNASVRVESGITTDLNISYPNLYEANKPEITEAFKKFQSDVFSLAVTMGVIDKSINQQVPQTRSTMNDMQPVIQVLKDEAKKAMDEIIVSLENVSVNVVPKVDIRERY